MGRPVVTGSGSKRRAQLDRVCCGAGNPRCLVVGEGARRERSPFLSALATIGRDIFATASGESSIASKHHFLSRPTAGEGVVT